MPYVEFNQKLKKKASNLINKLQERFPKAFPHKPDPKVPLAIGTFEDLNKMKEELEVTTIVICGALRLWCTGERYWTALSKVGVPRYDIYGNVRGQVEEKDVEIAQQNLLAKKSRKNY